MEIEKTKKIKHQFPSAREWDRAMDVWKIYGQNVGNYSSPRMDAGYWETNTTIFHWYSFDTNKKSHVSSPLPPLPSVFCWYLFLFGCQQKNIYDLRFQTLLQDAQLITLLQVFGSDQRLHGSQGVFWGEDIGCQGFAHLLPVFLSVARRVASEIRDDLGLCFLRIQVCPKKGISYTILFWGWDLGHQS